MATKKVTQLTADTSPSTDDLVMTVDSPAGTPTSKKVTLANLGKGFDTVYATTITATTVNAANMSATSLTAYTLTGTTIGGAIYGAVSATNVCASMISGSTIAGIIYGTVSATNLCGTILSAGTVCGATIAGGTLTALVPIIVLSGDITLSAAEVLGQMVLLTATGTITLPAVVIGSTVTIYSTTAAAIMVDPNVNDRIILDGTAGGDGKKVTSASAAGNFITLIGDSAAGWVVVGRSGTWTMEG